MSNEPCRRLPEAPLARVFALTDALHCGALVVNREGVLVHVNRRICELTGFDCRDLVGHNVRELYRDAAERADIEQVLAHFDEASEREFYLPRKDGTRLAVIASGRRLAGEPPLGDHRLVTVIDISRLKEAEGELEQRYRDIASLSDTVLEQALALKDYSQTLEEKVRERTIELHEANMEAIFMLAVAAEAKDGDTGAHVRRIQRYAEALAHGLGLPSLQAERIGYSAILHDVGKIQVPDEILKKPGSLTADEFAVMQRHTLAGERILSVKPFFDLARQIARSHHENWDGSGYPDGLNGAAIPLAARIVRVADVFDALTMQRPYKPAWPVAEALAELEREAGRSFDPELAERFVELVRAGRVEVPREAGRRR